MNITDNQSAKKIIFQIENLNESLREKALFFINMTKGQNHGTLSKDYQLKLWSTGSSCYYLDKLNKLFQIKFCHNYMENSVKSKIINLLQKKCVLNGN